MESSTVESSTVAIREALKGLSRQRQTATLNSVFQSQLSSSSLGRFMTRKEKRLLARQSSRALRTMLND